MKKIAIQGHSTRGEDVIKILESLGGDNFYNLSGKRDSCYYFINAIKRIDLCSKKNKVMSLFSHVFYTLEEYEQKSNNMETKRTIQINLATAREWYKQGNDLKEIALQAFSENELQSLPKSWKEYCEINPYLEANKEFFLAPDGTVTDVPQNFYRRIDFTLSMSSKKRAEQFVILNKLLQIRDYYNQGFEPDWKKEEESKYIIISLKGELKADTSWYTNRIFAFKTRELRDKFLTNFKKDLEFIEEFL